MNPEAKQWTHGKLIEGWIWKKEIRGKNHRIGDLLIVKYQVNGIILILLLGK